MTAKQLVTPLLVVAVVVLIQLNHFATMTAAALASADPSTSSVSSSISSGGVIRAPPLPEAKAEALISKPANQIQADSSTSQQNVIIIKYANVTTTKQGDDTTTTTTTAQQKLIVYQLYNEPLSVSVIESKFSHSIHSFDVSHNQLSTLSKDLFCPLSNEVRQLNISHNLLDNFDCLGLISQDGQLCLKELRVLDMSYNLIKHLPATGVATLQNLEVLNLSHNLIESLDEISLSSLFKLIKLDLSYNRIQQLPMRVFHKSTSMQILMLQFNQLQTPIDHSFLSGLISLEELNLSFNNISHVKELAFLDKPNLTRVDLSHNQLQGLRQEALKITISSQSGNNNAQRTSAAPQAQPIFKPRLHHNGQYAGMSQVPVQQPISRQAIVSPVTNVEFYLSSNPFVCDCQLEWMRTFQPAIVRKSPTSAGNSRFQHNYQHHQADFNSQDGSPTAMSLYQNDQPASVIQQQQQQSPSSASEPTASSSASNNISENAQANNLQSSSISATSSQQQQQTSNQPVSSSNHYGRIADLDLIKCSPLFRRNSQLKQQQQQQRYGSRSAPSDGGHHNLAMQVHHANNHLHHHHQPHNGQQQQQHHSKQSMEHNALATTTTTQSNMIDLLSADSSNFLCRYKSHCFALCHCCEFDACDCEMICPNGCNCYYNLKWQTNIIDCSSNNHTVVPERIPMDVSGLYLDGNNIDSLKPSNLIARKSLKTLYLNSTNLQYIANRTFNGLIELQTLYLNDNQLRSLNGYEFEPLAQLKALYLQSNRLDRINNQTFIYLRSLELLDLSNNRLTSMNLDLFMFIGHHNIRLRQLSIAHNWWSCQCNSISSFRQILKQKFLVNGGVTIVDRNQLRCYYNSTTVGPLILDGIASLSGVSSSSSSSSSVISSQPLFGSLPVQQQSSRQQQQVLTEINQCSDVIEERPPYDTDVNPPIIYTPPPLQPMLPLDLQPVPAQNTLPSNDSPDAQLNLPYSQQHNNNNNNNHHHHHHHQTGQLPNYSQSDVPAPHPYYPPAGPFDQIVPSPNNALSPPGVIVTNQGSEIGGGGGVGGGQRNYQQAGIGGAATASVPLASFVVGSVLFVCIFVVAISVFVFLRQQQQRYNSHHKKSSAASTTSVSSGASSTAISTHHHHHGTSKFPAHHDHHRHLNLASQPVASHFDGGNTLQHHLAMGGATTGQRQTNNMPHHANHNNNNHHHHHHHQHSASSQSNIYAALVPPTSNGANSTIVSSSKQQASSVFAASNANILYSNASHHSASESPLQTGPGCATGRNNSGQQATGWHHQPLYGSHQLYGQVSMDNPYAINASVASYKTGTSLYNASIPAAADGGGCHHESQRGVVGASTGGDWISLPKVKQFMSRLVNKSLALGGYRSASSRDELSSIASDKIYDAFLSYDKRDEPFVMQYLSAELEYGSPQYRVADRYRDLPLPSSAYIAEAITSVIGCSHRTIIVLTENYLASDWCRYELQAALRETTLDKSHKVIAVVLDPKCLQEMDGELRNLLLAATGGSLNQQLNGQLYSSGSNNSQQLVQLADNGDHYFGAPTTTTAAAAAAASAASTPQQLVTTLTNQSGGNQQVCTQTAASAGNRVTFINYNERKFWTRIKQLMPAARPSTQTLTLTTKN